MSHSQASLPPKVAPVPTPMAAEETTRVVSVNLVSDELVVTMASEHWEGKISFPQNYGFRVLDELDLTEFWSECSLVDGWLFEVLSGGWRDLEMTRSHFHSGRLDWVREYLIIGMNECVFVLTKEEPVIEIKNAF